MFCLYIVWSMDHLHTIKVVARRTGLSQHVIRIWEKRYEAVTPARSEGNRRLYADEEIARLQLLQQATLAGHSIGQIARLPTEDLRKLVEAERGHLEQAPRSPAPRSKDSETLVAEAF